MSSVTLRCPSHMKGVGRASGKFPFPTGKTHLFPINLPRAPAAKRWNSGQASSHLGSNRGGGAARQSRKVGWRTASVVSLVVGTGLAGFALAEWNARRRGVREREYSSEKKFKEPKYADVEKLKEVSEFCDVGGVRFISLEIAEMSSIFFSR
jgi:hypothetical protein